MNVDHHDLIEFFLHMFKNVLIFLSIRFLNIPFTHILGKFFATYWALVDKNFISGALSSLNSKCLKLYELNSSYTLTNYRPYQFISWIFIGAIMWR